MADFGWGAACIALEMGLRALHGYDVNGQNADTFRRAPY
jgi:hypothetical protein